jgi:hypothetical protein
VGFLSADLKFEIQDLPSAAYTLQVMNATANQPPTNPLCPSPTHPPTHRPPSCSSYVLHPAIECRCCCEDFVVHGPSLSKKNSDSFRPNMCSFSDHPSLDSIVCISSLVSRVIHRSPKPDHNLVAVGEQPKLGVPGAEGRCQHQVHRGRPGMCCEKNVDSPCTVTGALPPTVTSIASRVLIIFILLSVFDLVSTHTGLRVRSSVCCLSVAWPPCACVRACVRACVLTPSCIVDSGVQVTLPDIVTGQPVKRLQYDPTHGLQLQPIKPVIRTSPLPPQNIVDDQVARLVVQIMPRVGITCFVCQPNC